MPGVEIRSVQEIIALHGTLDKVTEQLEGIVLSAQSQVIAAINTLQGRQEKCSQRLNQLVERRSETEDDDESEWIDSAIDAAQDDLRLCTNLLERLHQESEAFRSSIGQFELSCTGRTPAAKDFLERFVSAVKNAQAESFGDGQPGASSADYSLTPSLVYGTGSPGADASTLRHQHFDDCGVVAQMMILEKHGVVASQSPYVAEVLMMAEAYKNQNASRGGGTPPARLGNLLVENGLGIERRTGWTTDEIADRIAKGKDVIVAADAGVLWQDLRYAGGGHAVWVCGVNDYVRADGSRLREFTVNDSGTGTRYTITDSHLAQAIRQYGGLAIATT